MKTKLVVVVSSCLFALAGGQALAQPQVGQKAPEVNVGEWFNLPGGMKSVQAKDLKGQIVMVEFWATW